MKAKGEDERELTKASYAAVNAEVAGPGVLQNVDIVDVSTIASQDSVSDSRAFGCQNIVGLSCLGIRNLLTEEGQHGDTACQNNNAEPHKSDQGKDLACNPVSP